MQKSFMLINMIPSLVVFNGRIVTKINDLLQKETVSFLRLKNLISQDPAITFKIMFIANSGRESKINTLEHALLEIGKKEIKNIFLILSFLSSYLKEDDVRENFKFAYLAGKIAEKLSLQKNKENLFLAGFLSNCIKFGAFTNSAFEELLEADRVSIHDASAYLLSRSRFSDEIVDYVKNLKTPMETKFDPVSAAIVHFASYIAGKRFPVLEAVKILDQGALELLGSESFSKKNL